MTPPGRGGGRGVTGRHPPRQVRCRDLVHLGRAAQPHGEVHHRGSQTRRLQQGYEADPTPHRPRLEDILGGVQEAALHPMGPTPDREYPARKAHR